MNGSEIIEVTCLVFTENNSCHRNSIILFGKDFKIKLDKQALPMILIELMSEETRIFSNPLDSHGYLKIGFKLGKLTIGEMVFDPINHELYSSTKLSYLQQGRLRECHCDCGTTKLISESALSTSRVKSCGCLRKEMIGKSQDKKILNMELHEAKRSVIAETKILQAKLARLRCVPVQIRDDSEINKIGAEIRSLFAQRSKLTLQISAHRVKK